MALATSLTACPSAEEGDPVGSEGAGAADQQAVAAASGVSGRLAQYAPTELTVDLSVLSEADKQVLGHLVEASDLMSEIFLRQVASGNAALREKVVASGDGDALAYFDLNFGPWDRLADMEPFLGERVHPSGAGYYPEEMTAAEFEQWLEQHPEDRGGLTSLTTMVGRGPDGGLTATPYSEFFREWLEPAAERLRAAAALADNDSLKRFLETRADAFGSDDYYESDLAWMDLSAPVEVTIGPYETYEDGLFGYKAAFESFVTVDVPAESAALARYKNELPQLERDLPIADEHKNMNRGTESPIRVVDLLYTGGEASSGVATLAFNLPNDERVREDKGSKKVMLRNVLRAKYDRILVPISERVLAPEDVSRVAFESYFNQVLQHELGHGLGPGKITVDGRTTEVRLELKELYSTMEEAKADVMGVYNMLQLMGRGAISDETRRSLEPTYVAGLFRSARFGVHEAHGQGWWRSSTTSSTRALWRSMTKVASAPSASSFRARSKSSCARC